ncbi:TPA: ead/Ea22-like family protein [Salmonella enterica subsp. enterica serovar Java]
MSNIDKRALREVAERATPGNWRRTSSLFNGITVTPFSLCGEEVTLAHTVEKRDAEFIAAANPATMLALLDELETKEEQRANWFRMAQKLGEDLDTAERLIAELDQRLIEYAGIATREARRVAELEAKLETGDRLQDNAFKSGMTVGWNYGIENNSAGIEKCFKAYEHTITVAVERSGGYLKDEIEATLTAEGIKVIEGEGQ